MMAQVQVFLLWFSAVGCAVIGGVYFAFSTFMMPILARLEKVLMMKAMQLFNGVFQPSLLMLLAVGLMLLMLLFFGTMLAGVILAMLSLMNWSAHESKLIMLASLIYVGGMLLVRVLLSESLDNTLVTAQVSSADSVPVWIRYLTDWTFLNYVRTVASIVASVIYFVVLARR